KISNISFYLLPLATMNNIINNVAPNRAKRGAYSSISRRTINHVTGCNDFMSLPLDVVENILDFLDHKQLTQFSVVAKPFRYCFNKGKKLDFDLSFQRGLGNRDLYMDVVGRIMEQHDGPRIKSLKLSFAPTNDAANQALVNRWITKAAQKGVEELDIVFNNGSQPFRLTSDLLQIKTIEILRLMFVDIGSPTESFEVTGLRFLRVCSMKRMSIDLFLLNALSNQCLELETLEIINCSTPSNMRFSAGKLKKFRLANCRHLREINLEAPSLISIHYTGHILAFNFKNCVKLVDFMIDLKPTRWVVFEVNRYHILLDKLMSSLSKIEVMTTTSRLLERLCMKFVESGMINHLYDLSMVKEIQLTLEGAAPCNMYSINYFLCKFSCVERIFIDVRGWIQVFKLTE
ncbi:Putative FBD-associated F-box protein At1g61330, partial [Linum perenne]